MDVANAMGEVEAERDRAVGVNILADLALVPRGVAPN